MASEPIDIPAATIAAASSFAAPQCNCNYAAVQKTVGKEGPNKGRQFWTCASGKQAGGCDFFMWDELLTGAGADGKKRNLSYHPACPPMPKKRRMMWNANHHGNHSPLPMPTMPTTPEADKDKEKSEEEGKGTGTGTVVWPLEEAGQRVTTTVHPPLTRTVSDLNAVPLLALEGKVNLLMAQIEKLSFHIISLEKQLMMRAMYSPTLPEDPAKPAVVLTT